MLYKRSCGRVQKNICVTITDYKLMPQKDKMHNIYYRPIWTCGHYDSNTHSAIMFNLIAGMSFFFEDSAADVIGLILRNKRGATFELNEITEKTGIASKSIFSFIEQLVNYGLISSQQGHSSLVDNYRSEIQEARVSKSSIGKPTDSSELFTSDAEKAYIKRVNKKAAVVMFELTYDCSEKCIHCYNPGATRNDTEKSLRSNRSQISLEQYKRVIDELHEEGTFKVCLTGGDPFSNPYIWDIIEYLYEKEMAFEIFTNAQGLVGKEEKLANYFPCYVAVSIYSAIPDVHDAITRRKGSLDKSIQVLRRLQSYCVPLIIKCVIMQTNVKTYTSVLQLAKELHAEVQFDCRLFDSSEGDKCVSQYLRLTPQQLQIVFRDRHGLYYVGKEVDGYGAIEHNLDEPACLTGWNNLCITPEGYVIPCCCFHAVLGDIKTQHINEIIHDNETLDKLISLKLNQYEECGTHDYCNFCVLCPGLNFSEHGTPLKAAENNCYYAKIRHKLYKDLLNGVDPLKGKCIESALQEMTISESIPLKKINSNGHFNEKLQL